MAGVVVEVCPPTLSQVAEVVAVTAMLEASLALSHKDEEVFPLPEL